MASANPYKTYLNIWLLLMFLTFITVYAAEFDFGALNVPIALLIASVKAGVVALHFMHLKYEDSMTWIFATYLFLAILINSFFCN